MMRGGCTEVACAARVLLLEFAAGHPRSTEAVGDVGTTALIKRGLLSYGLRVCWGAGTWMQGSEVPEDLPTTPFISEHVH